MSPLRRPFCPPLAIAAAMGSAPTSKIRHKLRNLLRPWGPCPYHLPPRNQSPWTPLPEPLYPPPPHKASFKTRHFSSLEIRRKLRNLLRPWGPCPYHLPPRNQSPWTLSALPCTLPHLTGSAPATTTTTHPPRTEALGPPSPSPCAFPTLQGILQKRHFFFTR